MKDRDERLLAPVHWLAILTKTSGNTHIPPEVSRPQFIVAPTKPSPLQVRSGSHQTSG